MYSKIKDVADVALPRRMPGTFCIRDRRLYCAVFVYRLKSDPQEWIYILESRRSTQVPDTYRSVLLTSGFQGADQGLSCG
jgi:hypothetical protein